MSNSDVYSGALPGVMFIFLVIAAMISLDLPLIYKIGWWVSGTVSALLVFNFKGENFGGGIGRAVSLGLLGFAAPPWVLFALIALVLDWRLCFNIDEEWVKEAMKRDRKIAEWARAGYPECDPDFS